MRNLSTRKTISSWPPSRRLSLFAASLLLIVPLVSLGADFRSLWKEGETRVYSLRIGRAEIGTQSATYLGSRQSSDLGSVFLFEMQASLDMSSLGQEFKAAYSCSLYCTHAGYQRAYNASYLTNGQSSSVHSTVLNDVFSGSVSRASAVDSAFAFNVPPGTYTADNTFITQWEIILSNLNVVPGDTHRVNILIPSAVRRVPVDVAVLGKESIEWDGNKIECTVLSCDFLNYRFYRDSDRRLLRVVEPRQSLIIDLLPEGARSETPVSSQSLFWSTLPRRLVVWSLYAAVSALLLSAFAGSMTRDYTLWGIIAVAGLLFGLVFVIQAPVQQKLGATVFSSIGSKGSGVYFAAFLIALVSGLFQETLKIVPLAARMRFIPGKRPNLKAIVSLGAAAGAGFGFVEACWLTGFLYAMGSVNLISLPIYERVITIGFHVATGAFLGYGIGRRLVWKYWLIAVVLHGLANFTIVFYRQGHVDAFVFQALLTCVYAAVFITAWLLNRRLTLR